MSNEKVQSQPFVGRRSVGGRFVGLGLVQDRAPQDATGKEDQQQTCENPRDVVPRTRKIAIEEFCQICRLEIKFGRSEII